MFDFILFIIFVTQIIILCLCISILSTSQDNVDINLDIERRVKSLEKTMRKGRK